QKYAGRMGKRIETISVATMQKLMRWHWPGNVRELKNLVERSVILTTGKTLTVPLPQTMSGAIDAASVVSKFEERERILSILRETNGRISGPKGAALRLEMKRSTLLDRMKKLGIDARNVRSDLGYNAQNVTRLLIDRTDGS